MTHDAYEARFSVERFRASELLPAISQAGAGWYNNGSARVASSLLLPRNGGMTQEFAALSLHPRSQIRALACYFDEETWPRALVAGQVIRRSFRTVRVEPLEDASRALGNVAGWTDAQSGAAAPISCQLGAVQLWISDPCVNGFAVGNRVQVVQDLISPPAYTSAGGVLFAHLLTCGAISATVAVANQNTTNAGAVAFDVYQADAAVRGTATPTQATCLFPAAAASLNLSAGASPNLAATATITNPASALAVLQGAVAAAGTYRAAVVVSLLYPQGAP